MRFQLLTGLSVFLLTVSCLLAGKDYPLVVNGRSDALIQLSPRASAPEYEAAVELQNYIQKISGVKLKRNTYPAVFYRSTGNADLVEILLVTLADGRLLLPPDMIQKLEKAECSQTYYIKTAGNRIIIAGKEPIGVLYGAYTFLEKYLDVHWFHPGADGESYPKHKNITIPEINLLESPDVKNRVISTWVQAAVPWSMEEVQLWIRRNKMNHGYPYHYPDRSREELAQGECANSAPKGGGHGTFEQALPQKHFKTEPELFQYQDGKWICKERSQRCLSNPKVQKIVADFVTEMTRYGAGFGIGYHDSTDGWCMCPNCVKMGTANGKFSYSVLAHKFSGIIAEKVLKQNPNANLNVLMYSQFRNIPEDKEIVFDSRVLGIYCPHQRCYVHSLEEPGADCNKHFLTEFEAWRKIYPKIGIFDYYSYANSPYVPYEYTFAKDAKLYAKNRLDTWIEDCTNKNVAKGQGYLYSNWPFYYAASKLLWDASLDIDALMDAAYTKYYGKAAAPMKQYQKLRRELWESAPGHAGYGGQTRIGYCLASPNSEKRLKGFLAEAKKLAGNDAVLRNRIAMDEKNLEEYWVRESAKIRKLLASSGSIPAVQRTGEIKIDGKLEEADWRKAPVVDGFLAFRHGDGAKAEPAEETRVKVLYDENNWYIGIEAMTEKAWSDLKASVRQRDGAVWEDDSVEIFIAAPGKDYVHLITNSIGTLYDAWMRNTAFDSGAELKTNVKKDRYTVEIRIPAEKLGSKIQPGQVWQMHFFRGMRNLQPPESSAGSSLDGTKPHDQINFRRVFTGEKMIQNGDFKELVPNKNAKLSGDRFPKSWGGVNCSLLSGNGRNRVQVKGGFLMQLLSFGSKPEKQIFSGEIKLKGTGFLNAWLSGCVRKPGDTKGFGHEIRRPLLKMNLDGTEQLVKFQTEVEPYELAYLYFEMKDGVVDYVTGTLSPVKK